MCEPAAMPHIYMRKDASERWFDMLDASGRPIEFAFAETDLFVLMRGCDIAELCCNSGRIPVNPIYGERTRS